jgi:hypothetical protein
MIETEASHAEIVELGVQFQGLGVMVYAAAAAGEGAD